MDEQFKARRIYAQSLRDAGHTLGEIGEALGVSRERIRQITAPGKAASSADPAFVMRSLRDRSFTSVKDIATAHGRSCGVVSQFLVETGLMTAATRLFRWRRQFPMRQRIASTVQAEAKRLGRTPTMGEIGLAFGWTPESGGALLQRYFGSTRAAMAYAGLASRERGGAGHRVKKQWTHCKRGHEFTPENTAVYAAGLRTCITCRRLRARGEHKK